MTDSAVEETDDDEEKQKDLDSSMNPLKSHYGIDIGLPKPLSKLLFSIIWVSINLIRLSIYAIVALVSFFLVYGLTMGVYCPFIYSGEVLTCIETQYMSPILLSPGIFFATLVIVIMAIIDYKIELRKYF